MSTEDLENRLLAGQKLRWKRILKKIEKAYKQALSCERTRGDLDVNTLHDLYFGLSAALRGEPPAGWWPDDLLRDPRAFATTPRNEQPKEIAAQYILAAQEGLISDEEGHTARIQKLFGVKDSTARSWASAWKKKYYGERNLFADLPAEARQDLLRAAAAMHNDEFGSFVGEKLAERVRRGTQKRPDR